MARCFPGFHKQDVESLLFRYICPRKRRKLYKIDRIFLVFCDIMAQKRKDSQAMKKKLMISAAALLAAAVVCLLAHRQIYNLYRDISYHLGQRTQAEQTVHDYARSHGLSYGEYPPEIISMLEDNPEIEPLVLSYPFREQVPMDMGGFARETRPLFLQWDPMWGYENYGSGYLALTGCGPTCLAMAGYYLTGNETMNPPALARFAEENGHYVPGSGSAWTLFSEAPTQLGLTSRELPLEEEIIVKALQAGRLVVLSVGKGDFTTTGHFILLTGVEAGGFRVNDPNSLIRSEKLWTYEELKPQIKNLWEIGRAE